MTDNLTSADLREMADRSLAMVCISRGQAAALAKALEEMRIALLEARRAIGDHSAPYDCFATGPLTGDPIRDLVQCPACHAIPLIDAALDNVRGKLS